MNIEKTKIINSAGCLRPQDKNSRIYFGDEFCQNKMPEIKDLRKLLKYGGIKVTLVFSYITQERFKDAVKILEFVFQNKSFFDEIVFNDWGLFYFIRNKYPSMKLVLGRLLTKQKTDPFAYEIIKNRQKAVSFNNNIFIPKKVSRHTGLYFSQTLINSPIFQRFMMDNNIIRVELNNLKWDMEIKLPQAIKASVYYPYVEISTTRFCRYLNMSKNSCKKQCLQKEIKLKKYRSPYNYIIKGNAVFFKNNKLPSLKHLQKNHIDRIVLND